MKQILYLNKQGARASYKDGTIIVETGGEGIIDKVSSRIISAVYVLGKVELSNSLINFIFRNGIDCVFMTLDGRFKGRIDNLYAKMIKLRQMQYCKNMNTDFALNCARGIISAKISNQRALLIRRRNIRDKSVSIICSRLRHSHESALACENIEKLLGVEGFAARLYWDGFERIIKGIYGFAGRRMHPPPDPVNAMLSFGYTLLFNDVTSLCNACGLDIYAGFYHAVEDRRASLALDLMEEFRTPAVDHLVMKMLNLKIIGGEDFEVIEDGIKTLLNEKGRIKLISNYRQRMNEPVKYAGQIEKIPLIMAVKHQIENYKCHLSGLSEFESYKWLE